MALYKSLRFNVVATLKHGDSEPVEMKYATETDEIGAAHAVCSILALRDDSPWAPNLLSIKVEVV